MEDIRRNWTAIVLTGVVTLVVLILSGIVIFYVQLREPRLVYSTVDTLPFLGPSENIAIYHVKIENDGKRAVEDVVCQLSFTTGTISDSRAILEPTIPYEDTVTSDSYRIELPSLNPQEGAVLSVFVSGTVHLPSSPTVSLRGKGITGIEASQTSEASNWWFSLVGVGAAYLGVSAAFITLRGRLFSKHRDDQRQILAYLCGIQGLDSEVERLLSMPSKASYWSESDRLSMLSVQSPNEQDTEKRKQVLIDLLEYTDMTSSSKGIVHYNIARIFKAQGNEEEVEKHLREAKKRIPKWVEKRVKFDQVWKL